MPITHPDPIWVTDNETLAKYCAQWLMLDAIALDTEFIRTDTFYPKPGLIQLGTGDEVFLLDPVTITDWQAFGEVLGSNSVIKILHACGEDIEVFHILTGVIPAALFDTQLAAAYCALGYSLGYQNLLKHLLNIDLPKDATRSDWLQRPLTDVQVSYATLDVVHLLDVYQLLKDKLADTPQWDWLLEDCNNLTKGTLYPAPQALWKDVKRAWQLRPQQLAVLQAICEFREREARRTDVPRNRVIPNGSLWPLARYLPDNPHSLAAIADMRYNIARQYGEAIINLIQITKATPNENHPKPLPEPLPKSAKEFGKLIKRFAGKKAEALNIPVELLMSGKLSTPILREWLDNGQFTLPQHYQGWRRTFFGEALLEHLTEQQRSK